MVCKMKNQKGTRIQAARWRRRKLLFTQVESGNLGALGKTAAPGAEIIDSCASLTYSCVLSER